MKVLIFSDIHSNFDALKTLINRESYDKAIFLGDIVDYGPEPAETLDLVFQEADYIVMGNHDYAVAENGDCRCAAEMHDLSEFTREFITKKFLSAGDISRLTGLKHQSEIEIDGRKMLITHASPNNNLFGYLFSTEAEMIWKNANYRKFDYIMVGHTHFPMLYRGKIVNPGSSGQPRDGNWMPMYALLDTQNDELVFKRFRYDNARTISKLSDILRDHQDHLNSLKKFYL